MNNEVKNWKFPPFCNFYVKNRNYTCLHLVPYCLEILQIYPKLYSV